MSKHKHRSKQKTPLTLLALLEEKIDEDILLNGVELAEEDLMRSTIKQPELFWLAGRLRVQLMHKRIKREFELEMARATIGMRTRQKRDDKGKREYTEGHVKAAIELDRKVQHIRKRLDRDFVLEELGKQLLEAYRMRRDVIRIVTDAGKISLHMRELELLKGNRKLRKAVENIRQNWKNPLDDE